MFTSPTPVRRAPTPQVSETQLIASICKADFYQFFLEFWDTVSKEPLKANWHIKYLCNEYQTIAENLFLGKKKLYDHVTNVPPGTSKSTIASIMFPAWLWTRMPRCQFIGASYSGRLAEELSGKTRDVIKSEKYQTCFPYIELREDQDTKLFFKNTAGGWRFGVGTGGSVLGRHGHIIVLDDPLDPEEALLPAQQAKTKRWIVSQLSERKVDKAMTPMCLVMQRLSLGDPTGYFLSLGSRYVCLPAELTSSVHPPELAAYYKNGLLDPERMPVEVLNEAKVKGTYHWTSQFLQAPIPEGSASFNTGELKFISSPPALKRVVRFWDKAGTASTKADYTAGVKMGIDAAGAFYVLDVVRGQWNSFDREQHIKKTAERDGTGVYIGVEKEPGSGGKESAENTIRNLAGFRVTAYAANKSTGDVIKRADPLSSQVNGGNVHVVRGGWNDAFVDEMRHFPWGHNDDQISAAAGAFNMLFKGKIRVGGMK